MFAGGLLGGIFYGIVIVLFFRCMNALLDPVNRARGGIMWGLVAHTVATFSFVTIATGMGLGLQPFCWIDYREFIGDGGVFSIPGPLGYLFSTDNEPLGYVPNLMYLFNEWLADGFLLYRCFIVYSKNYWVVTFPFVMYLACFATGIRFMYQTLQPTVSNTPTINAGLSYFTISVSLNVILTLMIVIRLVRHRRNIKKAMGASAGVSGLYESIVTILVESCALYTVASLLYLGPWGAGSTLEYLFSAVLVESQVISPLLVILRVANRRALTSEAIASGNISTLHFGGGGESTVGDESLHEGYTTSSTDTPTEKPGEHSAGAETIIEEVSL